jgi:enamine deaminase RidA (YjgF/YER057c/UK114 family)
LFGDLSVSGGVEGDRITMPVEINTRKVRNSSATEIYISAAPEQSLSTQTQVGEMFGSIREILSREDASILQERIFTVEGALDIVSAARSEAYGDLDDGVAPSLLTGRQGRCGMISGVQVHAVAGASKPEVVRVNGKACGRLVKTPGQAYITLSGISGGRQDSGGSRAERAKAMLEKAESALKQFGSDFRAVPRTWMWLGDILSWYGEFNKVRNQFFTERGLIGRGGRQSMPASTGIGLGLAGSRQCAMDLTAVLEPAGAIEFLGAIGRQQCALDYGSAFSRASRASTPAGETVFVSGTASIDTKGATTHIGDARGQIETTIENVRAVLGDMNCGDGDVVQAVAYCRTAEVEGIFEEFESRLGWPWVTAICDVCRDDLLFEVEAAAVIRK